MICVVVTSGFGATSASGKAHGQRLEGSSGTQSPLLQALAACSWGRQRGASVLVTFFWGGKGWN